MTSAYGYVAPTKSQQLMQNYASTIGLSDMMGNSSGNGFGEDLMMNMNSSVFGCGMGYYGSTQKEQAMFNNMTSGEITAYQIKEQEKLQESQRQSQLRTQYNNNTEELAITEHAARAKELVAENKQDEVSVEFGLLKTAVREKYAKVGIALTDKEVTTYAQQEYSKINGTSVVNDLKTHGDSEFTHGLKQGFLTPLVGGQFTQKSTPKDTLQGITGEEKTKGDKFLGGLGVGISTIATCLAVPLALLLVAKGGSKAASLVGQGYKGLWTSLFKGGAKAAVNVAKAAI